MLVGNDVLDENTRLKPICLECSRSVVIFHSHCQISQSLGIRYLDTSLGTFHLLFFEIYKKQSGDLHELCWSSLKILFYSVFVVEGTLPQR